MSEKRKLAAVMFTDIIGYTALMSKDEQKALKLLQKNREMQQSLAEKHNGEFLKEMGDGTLLCFQSALDAVRCAMEIQNSVQEDSDLNLRIGIHLGDIVFKEGDVFGDGVNVASRIERLAESGCICISEEVYRSVRNQPDIETEFLEKKRLKNVDNPVKIYKVKRGESHKKKSDEPLANQAIADRSIAVLPFVNMSADPEQEYFCDGMAEEIINALAHIKSLRVIARTSAFAFKGKNEDVREIGRKLDVNTLLEGSVRKAGSQLRITAQLIRTRDGSHLWSERYDRKMEDIFQIQDEITSTIVKELKQELKLTEISRNIDPTTNLEAYDIYLKGLFCYNQYTSDSIQKALTHFKKAVQIDPDFAAAHASLADSILASSIFGMATAKTVIPGAKRAIQNAMQLNPNLAEAYHTQACIAMMYDWDGNLANQNFRRAIKLNPNYALAIARYAVYFMAYEKNFKEALIHIKQAESLDPLKSLFKMYRAWIVGYQLDFGGAVQILENLLELDPHYAIGHYFLALYYRYMGMFDKATAQMQNAIQYGGRSVLNLGALGMIHASAGKKEKAEKILSEITDMYEQGRGSPLWIGRVYECLGKTDEMFEWLEKAYDDRDLQLYHIGVEPLFNDYREDSRLKALLKKMGFDK